jgi:hypothetical protein
MTVKPNHEPQGPTQPLPPPTGGRQGDRPAHPVFPPRLDPQVYPPDRYSRRPLGSASLGRALLSPRRGRHQLQVSYPYVRLWEAGKASAVFDVAPNQLVQASYRSPRSVLMAFLPGKLSVEPPAQS